MPPGIIHKGRIYTLFYLCLESSMYTYILFFYKFQNIKAAPKLSHASADSYDYLLFILWLNSIIIGTRTQQSNNDNDKNNIFEFNFLKQMIKLRNK
ncbi:hypothetical protein RIR_jg23051.t1 [Rhizophagus irregularis DAOM 181602=DAOM 197198]|nr:hypothetical protein RIR_jg23051.t1 [Rhizophagus irregularis DAOM 181602=DAOM 197198]